MADCGCKSSGWWTTPDGETHHLIEYCKLHKAAPEMYKALKDMLDPDDCSLDHHGYCQTHGWLQDGLCPHFRAKIALATVI